MSTSWGDGWLHTRGEVYGGGSSRIQVAYGGSGGTQRAGGGSS